MEHPQGICQGCAAPNELTSKKKSRKQRLDQLLSSINRIEDLNKSQPHCDHKKQLLSLRQELRTLLLESYEKSQRKLRATYYNTSNKAGKAMATHIRGVRNKAKIPFLTHPITKIKLVDPRR